MVERRLKEALKDDRARIQVGHISHFGLLEMSRQRLRPSLEETTLIICPHCNGTGHVRGTESAALHVLRGVEEEAGKRRSAEIIVHVATAIALYILNHKRERLNEIERRYGMRVVIAADDSMIAPRFRIERVRAVAPGEEPRFVTPDAPRPRSCLPCTPYYVMSQYPLDPVEAEEDDDLLDTDADDADAKVAAGYRRWRRIPRKAARRNAAAAAAVAAVAGARAKARLRTECFGLGSAACCDPARLPSCRADVPASLPCSRPNPPRRRRNPAPSRSAPAMTPLGGRWRARGPRRGRRRRGRGDGELSPLGAPGAEQPDLVPAYAGPTPADPFGSGHVFDIFDVMEQAELNAAQANRGAVPSDRRAWRWPLAVAAAAMGFIAVAGRRCWY